jgi:hypothetical protein
MMARELTICAVGDFCPRPRSGRSEAQELFAGVDELLGQADLRIINVEMPLTTKKRPIPKSGPHLIAPPEAADLLKGRFDIALLANNHILDHGPRAAVGTIEVLRRRGLRTVGAGRDHDEAARPLVVKAKGFSIAILNACEHEFGVAGRDSGGGAGLRPFDLVRRLLELRAKHDIVLVFTHGGNEMNPLPSPRVLAMSRAFAEAGASAVINTHPHVPQAVETWKGTPIAYSLGNFVFDSTVIKLDERDPLWWVGMPVLLKFADVSGRIKASMTPVFTKLDPASGRLDLVRGQRRAQLSRWLREVSRVLKDEHLLQEYFDAWTTVHGASYHRYLEGHACDVVTARNRSAYAGFRNLWTCEAHNELITTFARMKFDCRLKAAEARLATLKTWMLGQPVGL